MPLLSKTSVDSTTAADPLVSKLSKAYLDDVLERNPHLKADILGFGILREMSYCVGAGEAAEIWANPKPTPEQKQRSSKYIFDKCIADSNYKYGRR